MKLEKFENKISKKRKKILISISVIVLIIISIMLHKTFASFNEDVEFQVMKGQVDYFGNSDVYFAFYNGENQIDEMPTKSNQDNLVYRHGECDNGASIEWDNEKWAPTVLNLSKSKTKCSLYFIEKPLELDKDIPLIENGDGLYKTTHSVSEISTDWNKEEYRFAGYSPKNYVNFNNEKWRIIGLVNVKTNNGVEQRIKIVRTNNINGQPNFDNYVWDINDTSDWSKSSLKNMLNGIYYESAIGDCYKTSELSTCDFKNGQVKGLSKEARDMIDSDVIWNLAGSDEVSILASQFYERERGLKTGNNNSNSSEWTKENDPDYHKGIGLLYLSDYGYAVGGDVRNKCLEETNLFHFDDNNCPSSDWLILTPSFWSISPRTNTHNNVITRWGVGLSGDHITSESYGTLPTVYLKPNVKIMKNTDDNYGSIDNPFQLKAIA